MEPWDGPAAIAFTDGRQIGATLDRNGLRPARYLVTDDDRIVMASEAGVLPIAGRGHRQEVAAAAGQDAAGRPRRGPPHSRRGTQGDAGAQPSLPGLARPTPRSCWRTCRPPSNHAPISNLSLLDRQQAFGYTQEDLKFLMAPMATTGEEAIGSMGNDTPISALSDQPKPLYTYFKQNFAQVTNPPIDPIREELVMSLVSIIGPRPNLFDLEGPSHGQAAGSAPADPHQRGPGEDPRDLRDDRRPFHSRRRSTSPIRPSTAPTAWAGRSTACASAPRTTVRDGCNIIILSDRKAGADRIPIPALLATRRRAPSPDPQGPAHLGRPGAWRRASRARCIISRAWPATAPRRSTPISPSRR